MNLVTLAGFKELSKPSQADHPSTCQATPPSPSERLQPKAANDDDSPDSPASKEMSVVDCILNDLVMDETLPCSTEEDIAYNMDGVLVEEDVDIDSYSSDISEEDGSEPDINWREGE